jgi:hypothetical protein
MNRVAGVVWFVFLLIIIAPSPASASCNAPPILGAPPVVTSTIPYAVSWEGDLTVVPNFELQQAGEADFANPETVTVAGLSRTIAAGGAIAQPVRRQFRVRAACAGAPGPWSAPVSTILTPPPSETASEFSIHAPAGTSTRVIQNYLVPGFGETANASDTFRITIGVPWMTVFPAQGALSAGGTTIQITIDPALLPDGTTSAWMRVETIQAGGTVTRDVPVVVNLAGLVTPRPRDLNPPAGTRIIPAVAHADGFNSRFETDVRLTNASAEPIGYDLTYTRSGANGAAEGLRTTLTVASNATVALDDVVLAFFGAGVLGVPGVGTLEIRPRSGGTLDSFASSRTYNVSSSGTFGQFIPALLAESFIGPLSSDPLDRISLQQVASSAAYRTNLGLVEGSGTGVAVVVRLIDGNGTVLGSVPLSLGPYEHQQIGLTDPRLFPGVVLEDGRLEIEVTGTGGTVTAYASVLDNRTADPLLVSPVQAGRISESRYVLPGIAELNTARNFHSDVRIFNAGNSPVALNLTYRPQTGEPTPVPLAETVTIGAGAIIAVNNVLPTIWQLDGTAGAVTIVAQTPATLVATARTYSRDAEGGTRGQFIPAISGGEAVGAGERALQVLQLEQSANYRSNLGLFEVTGHDATIEIVAYTAAGASAPLPVALAGGEFRQIGSILTQLGVPLEANGRISVRVTGGTGRVSAYASVIDNRTEDPTYIPAQ